MTDVVPEVQTGGSASPPRRRPVELSSAGRALAGSVIVLYTAGVVLGYPILVSVAGGGILALLAAGLYVAPRPRLALRRDFRPQTVVAGQTAVALLGVTNQSRWPSPTVRVADRAGAATVERAVRSLPPGGSRMVRYTLPTSRRGRVELGPLQVLRPDPLGLLRRRQTQGTSDVLWVHPRTWPMGPLPAGVVVDLEGPVSETAAEGSLTFSGLREYVAGDDRRQIHWRSSARLGTLMVRQHVDANEPRATVVLDARPHLWDNESFEQGVEVAASVARTLTGSGHPVVLRIVGERPSEMRRLGAVTVADRLAATERAAATKAGALLSILDQGSAGGALVIVSGSMEGTMEARIGAQARRFAPVIVCEVRPGIPALVRRLGRLAILSAPSAAAVAETWNRMVR